MNEYMKKWIAALESGEYKQTRGNLAEVIVKNDEIIDTQYCCLGVACRVIGEEMKYDDYNYGRALAIHNTDGDGQSNDYWTTVQLPRKLRDQLGLTEAQQTDLIHMNDMQRASFSEIAAKLREWFA